MQSIDARWEEVNVRATNTLENIEENGELDRRDIGRGRKGSGDVTTSRQRYAGGQSSFCLLHGNASSLIR